MPVDELGSTIDAPKETDDSELTLDLTQEPSPVGSPATIQAQQNAPFPTGSTGQGFSGSGAPPDAPYPQFQRYTYNQPKQWDFVRMVVTLGLLAIFGWVVVWASIESASWANHWTQTKEMLNQILPAITGLIGSVIGFYFGSNTNSGGTGNSGNSGSGTGAGTGK